MSMSDYKRNTFEVTFGKFVIRHVTRDGAPVIKLRCPSCGVFADMDDDQYRGRVSVDCECGAFHETHNFAQLEAEALK